MLEGGLHSAVRATEKLAELRGRFSCDPGDVLDGLFRHGANRTARPDREALELLPGHVVSLRRLARRGVDVPGRAIADLGKGGFGVSADALDHRRELFQHLSAHRVELLRDATRQDANRLDRTGI